MTQSMFTLGADPEFFVKKLSLNPKATDLQKMQAAMDKIVSKAGNSYDGPSVVTPVCGAIGGTKDIPVPIPGIGRPGFFMQEDGIAAEFNIPPATSPAEFTDNIELAMQAVGAVLKSKGLASSDCTGTILKKEWVEKFPHIEVVGCDPDFNAYEMKEDGTFLPRVASPDAVGGKRGAGGHLHIGYPEDMCPKEVMAKFMDLTVGLHSVRYDPQAIRRQWWGRPGLFRAKPYGIEYRTLSNYWLWSFSRQRGIAAMVFALLHGIKQNILQWQAMYLAVSWSEVQDIILKEDSTAAADMVYRMRKQFAVYDRVIRTADLSEISDDLRVR